MTECADQFEPLLEKLRELLDRYSENRCWGEVSCIVVFREGRCYEVAISEKETIRTPSN